MLYTCIYVYQITSSYATVHIFQISVNKYCGHIGNICHTAIMLSVHIHPIFFHICAKRQTTAITISHDIAMYLQCTNMPHLKYHICQLF